jgi:hypothetical protein
MIETIFKILKDLLPLEIAALILIFIYFLKVFKDIASNFITLAEKQAEYLSERLASVDKTTKIFERTIQHQEYDLKRLYEVNEELKQQLTGAEKEAAQTTLTKEVPRSTTTTDFLNSIWAELIRVYYYAKSIYLIAEQYDENLLLQPRLELANSLDHIIRSKAADLGIREVQESDYSIKNLKRALAHQYRAFLDSADWLTIILRSRIVDILKPYPRSCINEVIPEYYETLRPAIDRISKQIASASNSKDFIDNLSSVIEEYKNAIEELISIYEKLTKTIPALEKANKKRRKGLGAGKKTNKWRCS